MCVCVCVCVCDGTPSPYYTQCAIDKTHLVESFNEVTIVLNITALDGQICSLPVPDCHHHDDEDNDDDHHDDKENGQCVIKYILQRTLHDINL